METPTCWTYGECLRESAHIGSRICSLSCTLWQYDRAFRLDLCLCLCFYYIMYSICVDNRPHRIFFSNPFHTHKHCVWRKVSNTMALSHFLTPLTGFCRRVINVIHLATIWFGLVGILVGFAWYSSTTMHVSLLFSKISLMRLLCHWILGEAQHTLHS